ncbi:winged helix-turn-helix transcriptional regulator [Flavobacterium psychrotrophum]|uniref:winged helix-turn-helix transcriptional regulator n=1 Tax=Flavobacterium psychrotrophum TaxID=2294119 RepID=UPI000E30D733|nr:helix-turn-helix domain-containing protein [Flavobacterium psychrotrophum]
MRKESSTNFENEVTLNAFCNASKTLALISGRWKLSLVFSLLENNERTFSDFKIVLPHISDRILALQLKELIAAEVIYKEKYGRSFNYILTPKGKALEKVLKELINFEHQ